MATISPKGKNLIFLISQPRAGSTLSQKILSTHSKILTTSEPWLMLSPLYARNADQIKASYNSTIYKVAVEEYINFLPNGDETYKESIRRMYSCLYNAALQNSEQQLFLDKTPRYYSIIPELYRIFPEAKYLILVRNPLAVLCSILSTWVHSNWLSLSEYRQDLFEAPQHLLDSQSLSKDNHYFFHYENLLESPEIEIFKICNFLDIEFESSMLNYCDSTWKLGDQKSVNKKSYPDSKNVDRWVQQLHDPQSWRVVQEYLKHLGSDTIESLGYSYRDLQSILDKYKPSKIELAPTFSLTWYCKKREERKKIEYEYHFVKLVNSLQTRGLKGTVQKMFTRE